MSEWAAKMHKKATSFGNVMTSCSYLSEMHLKRIEKVRFATAFPGVCKQDDLPAPLLVLILKLNKEAPIRKDVFRAPGHLASVKKLIHYLESGVLVNIDNFSVYTIASVLKKFLRKIPNGIFGIENEQLLFRIITLPNVERKCAETRKLILSLPNCTQKLLVMLFGTFRVIALNSSQYNTGMTSEAIGISVAPSFFKSCVSNGKVAKMEDVLKFKTATQIVQMLIDNFSTVDLFDRNNYEYYARVTGRILKIENEWICSFLNPSFSKNFYSQQIDSGQLSSEDDRTWLQCECARWRLLNRVNDNLNVFDESHSLPTVVTSTESKSLSIVPDFMFETCTRLSVSLNNNSEPNSSNHSNIHNNKNQLLPINQTHLENSHSWSFLPLVHERQTERMKNRSRWFLTPSIQYKNSNYLSVSADSISREFHIKESNNRTKSSSASPQKRIIRKNHENGGNGFTLMTSTSLCSYSPSQSSSSSSTSMKRKLKKNGVKSNSFKLKLDENYSIVNWNSSNVSAISTGNNSGIGSLTRPNSCKQIITKSNSFNDRFCKCSIESLPKMKQVPFMRISLT